MFEKKDIIVSSTMGLCIVADVTKLSADKKAPVPYYVLKSYYDTSKVAYIPVENHEVVLRQPMDKDSATSELEKIKLAISEDDAFEPDELMVGEVAYVLGMKIEEIIPKTGEDE